MRLETSCHAGTQTTKPTHKEAVSKVENVRFCFRTGDKSSLWSALDAFEASKDSTISSILPVDDDDDAVSSIALLPFVTNFSSRFLPKTLFVVCIGVIFFAAQQQKQQQLRLLLRDDDESEDALIISIFSDDGVVRVIFIKNAAKISAVFSV